MTGTIQLSRFLHPVPYHYRTQTQKLTSLCQGRLRPLGDFLDDMHFACPDEPFESGPRASKTRYTFPVEMTEVVGHIRSQMSDIGLEVNSARFRTAHSRVQCYMLEEDSTTIAVEVPVWADAEELSDCAIQINDDEYLSGHIDVLSVEESFVWVWDYKPGAAAERFAKVQILLYAAMLSHRTSVPLNVFRCGYFDRDECYWFKPSVAQLQSLEPVPSGLGSTLGRSAGRQIPELVELGIEKPSEGLSDTVVWSWWLFSHERLPVTEIAKRRSITESTVFGHIAETIRHGVLTVDQVVSRDVIQRVLRAFQALPTEDQLGLKPLYESLDGTIDYGIIKCVLAAGESDD